MLCFLDDVARYPHLAPPRTSASKTRVNAYAGTAGGGRTPSLVGCGKILGCVRARSSHEEQSPIRQRDIASVRSQSTVFRAVAVHDDLGAGSQGLLREPRPYQRTRRSRLDSPILDASVRRQDSDVDPCMRI